MPRNGLFIQARLSSQRLPGKMLMPMAGRPLLQWVLEAVEEVQPPAFCAVLTSDDSSDDAIAEFCQDYGVDCFRGSLNNVAERFLQAAEFYRVEAFVRINGDSPLMNPRYLEQAIDLFMQDQPDLLTNVMPRSFPKGVSIEMLNAATYDRMYPQFATPDHFEHVTQFFYQNPDAIRILNFGSGGDWGEVRFVVDTAEDFGRIESLLAVLEAPPWTYPLEDLIALYQQGQAE